MDAAQVDNSAASDGLSVDGWSTGYVTWTKAAGFIDGQGQYDAMTAGQVNAALAAYCAAHSIQTVTAGSATRGDVVMAQDAIYTAANAH